MTETQLTGTTSTREWNAVADAWDLHADQLEEHTAALAEALLDGAAVKPGDRVLELAAGPGTLGPMLSRLVGEDGRVVLSDIAPAMLEVAARRNAALANVEVARIDASAIDEPDGSFDVVVSRMGLMFTPDPSTAFGEIRRVLADGGRMGALTWAAIEHNPWMTSVGMAAMMAGLATGGPPVGPGAVFSLGDPDHLRALAEGAGFHDVAVQAVPVSFRADTADAHIDRVSSLAGPLAAFIRAGTTEQQATFRRTARDLVAQYVTADGVVAPGRALLVTARR